MSWARACGGATNRSSRWTDRSACGADDATPADGSPGPAVIRRAAVIAPRRLSTAGRHVYRALPHPGPYLNSPEKRARLTPAV